MYYHFHLQLPSLPFCIFFGSRSSLHPLSLIRRFHSASFSQKSMHLTFFVDDDDNFGTEGDDLLIVVFELELVIFSVELEVIVEVECNSSPLLQSMVISLVMAGEE